ncbi:zinc finger and BTB domain-containing protein 24-like [Centruroides sculpturatus]|uniref:zinc finger and BTB domain-containing protein 24-like n=1 Tax=Centruroides sculpturatus TaxID=218467 RepID=UPI000C6D48FB|nr:zinc finger and BTB domain-containing protein 24-like [Centruroides sculpturatus]
MEYTCSDCGMTFSEKSAYLDHQTTHAEKTFKCDRCLLVFQDSKHLDIHKKIHSEVSWHMCEICNCGFTGRKAFEQHQNTHTEKQQYTCITCEQIFQNDGDLQNHVKSVHKSERSNYICEICNKEFDDITTYKMHCTLHQTSKKLVSEARRSPYKPFKVPLMQAAGHSLPEIEILEVREVQARPSSPEIEILEVPQMPARPSSPEIEILEVPQTQAGTSSLKAMLVSRRKERRSLPRTLQVPQKKAKHSSSQALQKPLTPMPISEFEKLFTESKRKEPDSTKAIRELLGQAEPFSQQTLQEPLVQAGPSSTQTLQELQMQPETSLTSTTEELRQLEGTSSALIQQEPQNQSEPSTTPDPEAVQMLVQSLLFRILQDPQVQARPLSISNQQELLVQASPSSTETLQESQMQTGLLPPFSTFKHSSSTQTLQELQMQAETSSTSTSEELRQLEGTSSAPIQQEPQKQPEPTTTPDMKIVRELAQSLPSPILDKPQVQTTPLSISNQQESLTQARPSSTQNLQKPSMQPEPLSTPTLEELRVLEESSSYPILEDVDRLVEAFSVPILQEPQVQAIPLNEGLEGFEEFVVVNKVFQLAWPKKSFRVCFIAEWSPLRVVVRTSENDVEWVFVFWNPAVAFGVTLVVEPVEVCPEVSMCCEHLGQAVVGMEDVIVQPLVDVGDEGVRVATRGAVVPLILPFVNYNGTERAENSREW